jgi:ribosomal protein S18 acetylase RimI-like enzyme
MPDLDLLRRLDAYLDAVPRSVARAESVGPFTLFVNQDRGWRYYARPAPGVTVVTPSDVEAARDRQRALAQPEAFEWVEDLTQGVGEACATGGLRVDGGRPLMALDRDAFVGLPLPGDAEIAFLPPDDPDLATVLAVAHVGFDAPGTAVGDEGAETLPAVAATIPAATLEFQRERVAAGLTVIAVVRLGGAPVASGAHQPVDGASEIVGVATLPSFRRRGLAAALTSALARDAFERGVETVLLSAGSADVARIYARVGFRQVGTVGEAGPEGA